MVAHEWYLGTENSVSVFECVLCQNFVKTSQHLFFLVHQSAEDSKNMCACGIHLLEFLSIWMVCAYMQELLGWAN